MSISTPIFRSIQAIGLAMLVAFVDAEAADHSNGILSIQLENDLFGDGYDRHYTHGTRITWYSPENRVPGLVDDISNYVPGFWADCDCDYRAGMVLGQNIFTPEDITVSELQPTERPYAGWFYLGFSLVRDGRHGSPHEGYLDRRRMDALELDIGMVGPASLAEDVQTTWHEFIDTTRPRGWDNQLDNELGLNLYYTRQWQFLLTPPDRFARVDLIPSAGYALGNVHTYGAAGVTLRLGNDLLRDYGPPRIQPSLPGSGFYKPQAEDHLGWYLFAGVEGRAVLRNIFLDGNTFSDSHSVDKKTWVGDIQAGLVLTYGPLRLAFTNIWRSREFEGQSSPDEFGAINLSLRL